MTLNSNRDLMVLFLDFINDPDENKSKKIIDTNAVFFVPGRKDPMIGPKGYLDILNMMRAGFSDIKWQIQDLICEDNRVAARFIMKGTHDGTFFNIPATNNKIEIQAINIYEIKNGKVIKEYGQPDFMNLLNQIS